MEEATKCLCRTSIQDQYIQPECASLLVGTDKYHIQVIHHLRVKKNALNEYDQYAIYLAILYHAAIDMFSVCSHLQCV